MTPADLNLFPRAFWRRPWKGHWRLMLYFFCTLSFAPGAALAYITNLLSDDTWRVTSTLPPAGWNTSLGFDDSDAAGWEYAFKAPQNHNIWFRSILSSQAPGRAWFRKVFVLPTKPGSASATITFDDDGEAYINGTLIVKDPGGGSTTFNLQLGTNLLVAGENLIAVHGIDTIAPDHSINVRLAFDVWPAATLVATGSVWKYLDDGSDQGAPWRALKFDDSAWPSGPAQLGYGDGDEATTNSFGPDPNNKYITYYYRHSFVVDQPSTFTNLQLRLLRDDGAIAYLNGKEVFRSNLGTGAVSYLTFAQAAAEDDGTIFIPAALSPSALLQGTNVLAVEVHQNAVNSSDISFDCALLGNVVAVPAFISTTHEAPSPPPILEFRFNETGSNAASTGTGTNSMLFFTGASTHVDLHSTDGAGVSGLPGDRSFDNSLASGMGSTGSGGRARTAGDVPNVNDLYSLTLQGWFRAQGASINGLARLITKQAGNTSFLLLGDGADLQLEINNNGPFTSGNKYVDIGEWVFFAITYDGTTTTNNAQFYKGTRTSPVVLAQTLTVNEGRALASTNAVAIGNSGDASLSRPFDGWLDNFRVFGSKTDSSGVLTLQQLESWRNKDVQNLSDLPTITPIRTNGVLFLSWPLYPGGFHLQSSDLTAPVHWSAVTNSVTTLANQYAVKLPASKSSGFFRLSR